MVVHARHDHSFRVPRPDLSDRIGAPNACVQCHRDKSNRWAAEAALRWWGGKRRQETHYGEIVHAGREELAGAGPALASLVLDAKVPAIRRATAALLLASNAAPGQRAAIERAVADSSPLVRDAAASAAAGTDPAERLALLSPLLRDPILTVRIDAARALVSVPTDRMTQSEKADFDSGIAEWVRSQLVDSDRAEAHLNLGAYYAETNDLDRSEREYRTAIEIAPGIAGTYVNLADLYRMQGREEEAEKTLRRGLEIAARDAGLQYALGLTLVRVKRLPEALAALQKAATLPPERPRYAYVYGVALDSVGRTAEAIRFLAGAHERHTGNRDILAALASFNAKIGNRAAAIAWARKLVELDPANPEATQLLATVQGPGG
jgi:tetratricopeptide (TPR) repeat protein